MSNGNAKQIPGIPEVISRASYTALFQQLGIDPHRVTELRLCADGVYVTLFALDSRGHKVIDPRVGPVLDSVYIPVGGDL